MKVQQLEDYCAMLARRAERQVKGGAKIVKFNVLDEPGKIEKFQVFQSPTWGTVFMNICPKSIRCGIPRIGGGKMIDIYKLEI